MLFWFWRGKGCVSHMFIPNDENFVIFLFFFQGLKSELEKASPSLGRSAMYLKESRINGLPRYNLLFCS